MFENSVYMLSSLFRKSDSEIFFFFFLVYVNYFDESSTDYMNSEIFLV